MLSDMNSLHQHRPMCLSCRRPQVACYCDRLSPIETNTHFVIAMHPMERKRIKTGTGRMTHLSLPSSEIVYAVDFTDHLRVNQLLDNPRYFPILVFPGPETVNLTHQPFPEIPSDRTPLLFLLDGTWECAQKIYYTSDNLAALPTLSFDVKTPSQFTIKNQPHDHCLSTIETIHRLLTFLDRDGLETVTPSQLDTFLRPFHWLNQFQLEKARQRKS